MSLGDNKSKIADVLFKKGSNAVTTSSFDYAIDCFQKCAKLVPDRLTYRQALRAAEYHKYGNNKTGAGALGKMKMKAAAMMVKAAKTRKKWPEVLVAAENALFYNPWDSAMLYELGNACKQLEYIDIGIWVLETAAQVDKQTKSIYQLLGELYEAAEEYSKALKAFEMVHKIDPTDHEAAAKARQMAANATLKKGKYGEGEAASDAAETAAGGEVGGEEIGAADSFENRTRKEISKLETELVEKPQNSSLCAQLAEKYQALGQYPRAAEMYQRALACTESENPDLSARLLDCQIAPLRADFETIKQRIAKLDKRTPDAAEKLKRLNAQYKKYTHEIINREIEMYRFRVQHNPEDYAAHYELGYRCLQLQKYDDAIKSLQLGRNDHRHKWDAHCYLGVAFWKKRNYALAEKNLSDAMAHLPPEDEEAKKRVLYYRGSVAQEREDNAAAINYFNEIAAIDYGYKDVAKRLDELNQ